MEKPKKLRALRENQKQVYHQESQKIVDETYSPNTYAYKLKRYRELKHLKWWHWLIVLAIAVVGTGFSFLIGYLTIHSAKAPNWQGTGWCSLTITVLLVVAFLILGWIRNKKAVKFFNDRRRRYQKTLEDGEAVIQLIRKILFLSFLPLLIVTIVTNIVF